MKKALLTLIVIIAFFQFSFGQWVTGSGGVIYYTGGNVGIGTGAAGSTLTVNGYIQSSNINLNLAALNTFIGANLGAGGTNNTFLGNYSGRAITTGTFNTILGVATADSLNTGSRNIIVGAGIIQGWGSNTAQNLTSGSDNIILGANTGVAMKQSNGNVAIGTGALISASGNYNTAVGYTAGYSSGGGSNNTFIGNSAGYSGGTVNNSTAIGYNAQVTADSSLVLGAPYIKVGIGTSSPKSVLSLGNSIQSKKLALYESANVLYGFGIQANTFQQYIASDNTANHFSWGNMSADGSFAFSELMRLTTTGNLSIGTTDSKGYMFAVAGSAIATSITVKPLANWPDYVFKHNHQLLPLEELKTYIDQNQHLPEMPSEQDVVKNGLNLGEMNKLLVKKVEELTLYMIEKEAQVKSNEEKIKAQNERIEKLEKAVYLLMENKNN